MYMNVYLYIYIYIYRQVTYALSSLEQLELRPEVVLQPSFEGGEPWNSRSGGGKWEVQEDPCP